MQTPDKNYCYLLRHKNPKYKSLTYNGFTNNPERRIRQHNSEITGGAKYTTKREGNWEYYMLMTGFETQSNAKSCEWRIKCPTKAIKRPIKYNGIIGRILGLISILKDEKWTNACDISNYDCQYRIYVTTDVVQYIDLTKIPDNISVYSMDVIVPELCI